MAPARNLPKLLSICFALFALLAPSALAAEGIGPGKALGGSTTTVSTSGTKTNSGTGGAKEALVIGTVAPIDASTVSGTIDWEAAVSTGSPNRVEFLVDGAASFSDSSAPYGGTLDTTKLANGSHTLSATAYGSRGVKATTSVTVNVSNGTAPSAPELGLASEPLPESGTGAPVYWGATIGNQFTGTPAPWDMTPVSEFQELTGKSMSLVHFFQPWSNCSGGSCSFYSFPWTPLENVRNNGSIPVVSWDSETIPSSVSEPDYQLSDIISGRYDSYIREWAGKAKQWGHPFFLRFDWEMNGNWFPWSEGVNGNKTGEFVAAWRHVHDIFTAVGATNVTWVWCPNVSGYGGMEAFKAVSGMYPGDEYVDWTGLDGYNWGTNPSHGGQWQTFSQLYRASYRYLVETVAPNKPLMIGEVASSEYGGSKATWIREMLTQVPTEYPKIRALLWFDKYDSSMDWPIETSSTATEAFAEVIKNPTYPGASFGSLSTSKIQPLS
ncbi:MAG TPA: Ig-like domain-containing protein [Solirubrobacterales bacterium]|nr:Ig-like domain-containing protein [Solirubrobacterales bacterium]